MLKFFQKTRQLNKFKQWQNLGNGTPEGLKWKYCSFRQKNGVSAAVQLSPLNKDREKKIIVKSSRKLEPPENKPSPENKPAKNSLLKNKPPGLFSGLYGRTSEFVRI